MGFFIDRHAADAVSDQAFGRAVRLADEHRVDSHGVLVLGHWLGSRLLYCLLEAPDREAVRQNHADLGLACDDLHEIKGELGAGPPSTQTDQVVRASIARLWSLQAA